MWMTVTAMTVIGFLSGSVMYSYLLPRIFYKVDIREGKDDSNPGGANAMASVGVPMGLLVILFDVGKAFAPVFISLAVFQVRGWGVIPVAVAPVLGHAFSPWLKGRGGKAVSSSLGALLGLLPLSLCIVFFVPVLLVFFLVIVIEPNSLKIIVSYTIACLMVFVWDPLLEIKLAVLCICLVVAYKHVLHPNTGAPGVKLGPFAIRYEDKKVTFKKI